MENAVVSRIIETQNADKVRLEVRQQIDRNGASTDPLLLANLDDDRFSGANSQVGWLTYSKAMLAQHCKDLAEYVEVLEGGQSDGETDSGQKYIDVGLENPVFTIEGEQVLLALRVVDTITPSEYDKTRPQRAKRMGEDGDFLLDENGKLIFSYTQVGFVFTERGFANFASAGSASRKKVLFDDDQLPEDRHNFIGYVDTVSKPSLSMIHKESLTSQSIPQGGNIVEDADTAQPEATSEEDEKEEVETQSENQ